MHATRAASVCRPSLKSLARKAVWLVAGALALSSCRCGEVLDGVPEPQLDVVDGDAHSRGADPHLTVNVGVTDSGVLLPKELSLHNAGTGFLEVQNVCFVVATSLAEAKAAACTSGNVPFVLPTNLVGARVESGTPLAFEVGFRPVTGGPARAWLQISSNAIDEPKGAIELVGTGSDGHLCVDPSNGVFDFGSVNVDSTAPGSMTITNCGLKPITLETFTFARNPDDAFGVTPDVAPAGHTLQPNEQIVLALTFTPASVGPYRDTRAGDIAITTAAPYSGIYDLLLVGDGAAVPTCQVNVVPATVDFAAVASGASSTQQLIIQSVGQCACTVSAISPPTPGDVGFTLGTLPTLPAMLRGTVGCADDPANAAASPNQITVDITYTAPVRDTPVADAATVDVTSTDANEPVQTVNLSANGGGSPYCELHVTPEGGSSFIPPQGRFGLVEFGRAPVHIAKRAPIVLSNIGNATCTVSSLVYDDATNTLANEFSLENPDGTPAIPAASFTIAPGQERTFMAVFKPTHAVDGGSILSFGSYSGSTDASGDPFTHALLCGGSLTGPNERCNGVTFTTTDSRTDVSASDRDPGVFSIGFSGTPVEPLVDVIPPNLDFGLVTLDCGSPLRRTTVYNNGGSDLVVTAPYIDPASDPFKFRIEGTTNPSNTWPYSVPPGGSLSINVRYFARTAAAETATLVIPTQLGADVGPPITVPLAGEGTTEISTTDVFHQFGDPKVDVLWVVDDSGSMGPFTEQLANNFGQFFTASRVDAADYHIAVTTTLTVSDTCTSLPARCDQDSDCGVNGVCDFTGFCSAGNTGNGCPDAEEAGYYTSCDGNERFITPASNDPRGQFECNVRVADTGNVNPSRPASDAAEGGFRASYRFLTEPRLSDPAINGGFLRDDAKLNVIMVSDELEQSVGSVDQYIDFFRNLKGFRNASLVSVSAIGAGESGCTLSDGTELPGDSRYPALVAAMNGRFESICTSDWTTLMGNLGLDSLGLRVEYFLSRAATAETLSTCVRANGDGDPTCTPVAQTAEGAASGYFYDPVANSIVFQGTSVPPKGSTIEVRYDAFCYEE